MQHRFFTAFFFASISIVATGQIVVRVDKPARLFSQPTERASVLTEIGGRGSFRALEQSADRQWIFISDGLRYGWIRKLFVRAVDEGGAAVSDMEVARPVTRESVVAADTNKPDEDFPEAEDDMNDAPAAPSVDGEDNLDDPDSKNQIYLVRVPGTFYELPKKNTDKFGKLEPNDSVELLKTSEDDMWVRVRLTETGEEGWIPKSRIGRKIPKTELTELDASSGKFNHIGVSGVFAPTPWGIGVQGFFRRGFQSLSVGGVPVEFGIGGGMNVGMVDNYLGQDIDVSYLDARVFTHWEPLLSPRFGLPIELGLVYKRGEVTTTLTQQEFESSGSRIIESEIGGYLGLGLTFFILNSLSIEALPQVQFTSTVDFILNAGAVFSF